jgi:hypothetical protein
MLGQMDTQVCLLKYGIAVTVWVRTLLTMHMWDIRVGELLNKNRMEKTNELQKEMVTTFDVGNGGRPHDGLASTSRTDKVG